ncbi:SHD1 domain-containing protein [Rhodopirellula sp. JC639]|uniref:SHD1 domain-containing protein n=1 Tax=Stieleria mannarensis TaxID=2755585 RepID=UPI001602AA0E|nr:SHD1 domain-containing protein [Rhodopirellula sp. JC639]
MHPVFRVIVMTFLCIGLTGVAQARTWTDKTGRYTLDAELFAFNGEHVVVQREDGEMGMLPIDVLSDDDKDYLQSEEAATLSEANLDKEQAWTMKDGYRLVGRIVDYTKRTVTVQRRRAKSWVNDRQYKSLPAVYQVIIRKSLEHLEGIEDVDDRKFESWLVQQKGQPRVFDIEGVVIELADGNEYTVPFFLFSNESLKILKAGWDEWLAAHGDEGQTDDDAKNDEAFRLQSMAAAMQHDRAIRREIAVANLAMNAVNAGLTSFWEVTLYPGNGNMAAPIWVVVPGRDSRQARFNALQQYPGFTVGPTRKVSR